MPGPQAEGLDALKRRLTRLAAQKHAIDKQEALLTAQKLALEALDAFHLDILTPQQSAAAQAAHTQPQRELVKEHEAIVAEQRKSVDALCAECEAIIAAKEEGAAAEAWLREKGFDPDGDLCEAIENQRDYDEGETTAIYEACHAGELYVCKYLFDHGAASTIRASCGEDGSTPMSIACEEGHLDVAQWLFEVGAAEDIRTKNNGGRTPLLSACLGGSLDVVQWLFEVGAFK